MPGAGAGPKLPPGAKVATNRLAKAGVEKGDHDMRFLCIAVAALALALLTPQLAQATSSAGCNGFDGLWLTKWPGSTTRVRISGAHGNYDYLNGKLRGSFSGSAFYGTYREENGDAGHFRFVLSSDGNSFSGWYSTSANPDQRVSWSGICAGP
jgi:hypothetical protein